MTSADWLAHLYAHTNDGWVTLFSVDRTTGEKHTDWVEIADLDALADIASVRAQSACVWFGVSPRAERLTNGRRGGAGDCISVPALWLDIDVASEVHAADDLPPTKDAALDLLDDFPLPPTAVVDSGHGLQAWWQLTEPIDVNEAAGLLADWGTTWAEIGRRRGWHIDNVFDIARVMRLPGTWNRKAEPRLVEVLSADWTRTFGIDDIEGHTIDAPVPDPAIVAKRNVPYIGPERPGDAYNAVTDAASILEAAGFHFAHADSNGDRHYRAPHRTAKSDTTGATVYADGHTTIWSETFARGNNLETRRPYDPFGLYAAITHRGDWAAATSELRRSGYGSDNFTPVGTFAPAPVDPGGPWPEPIPLDSGARTLPTFPTGVFPYWIEDQVRAVAAELQMPPDLPAVLALVCLASLSAKATKVNVRGRWTESLNIYVAVAMPPSAGKSPAFSAMVGPVRAWEARRIETERTEYALANQRYRMAEKAMTKAEQSGDPDAAQEAALKFLSLEPAPASPRVICDDVTPEALAVLLSEQKGKIAMLSTEGGVFDIMTGRYSDRANLDVYLKAWGGDDITVDRVGRGNYIVRDPALTIGITVQPSVIAALAEKPELAGRGVTARFMYSLPSDNVGHRNFIDQPETDPAIGDLYAEQMAAFAARVNAARGQTWTLTVAADAAAMFHQWRQAIERRRKPDADMRALAEWSTKLESTVLRVAGLLHLAYGGATTGEIATDMMERAIAVGDYWIEHAFAVHDMWGTDATLAKARKILEWAEGRSTFTVRDLYSSHRRTFPKADQVIEPLGLLYERGWIRPSDGQWPPSMRRGTDSPEMEVHPSHARHVSHVYANSDIVSANDNNGVPDESCVPCVRDLDEKRPFEGSHVSHVSHVSRDKKEDSLTLYAETGENTAPRTHETHGTHDQDLALTGTDDFNPF